MLRLIVISMLVAMANCQTVTSWWSFSYTTCTFGPPPMGASITYMYVDGPIYHPGETYFQIDATLLRPVNGLVNGTVDMYRTVSGLRSKVPCTILPLESGTTSIGSCVYPDLCDLAFTLLDILDAQGEDCPDYLTEYGIPCTCPWQIPAQSLVLEGDLEITDLAQFGIAWLVSGQFEVNVKASASGLPLLCLDMKMGIAPASFTTRAPGKKRREIKKN